MCERASFVYTKHDEFYLPQGIPGSVPSESHTDIRMIHGLPDTITVAEICLAAEEARPQARKPLQPGPDPIFSEYARGLSVECIAPDGDYSQPFYHWKLSIDQDIQPVWARDTSELLTRAHLRLPDWAKSRIMVSPVGPPMRNGVRVGLTTQNHLLLQRAGVDMYWPCGTTPYPFGITRESLPEPILKAFADELALDGEHAPCLNGGDLVQALDEHGCAKANAERPIPQKLGDVAFFDNGYHLATRRPGQHLEWTPFGAQNYTRGPKPPQKVYWTANQVPEHWLATPNTQWATRADGGWVRIPIQTYTVPTLA